MQLSKPVRSALEECAECLYVVDEKTKKIVYCSSALKKNKKSDAVGTECYKYLFDKTEICSFCPSLNENGSLYKWEMFDVSCKSWLSIKNRLVSDNGTVYRVGCINKIQELMNLTKDVVGEVSSLNDILRRQEQLKYLLEWEADHDMMTRLFNRGRYMKDLENVFPKSRDIAIIYLDINNLKWTNDNIGHNAGDALIKCIAGLLEERITDKIRSYRLGGDEFMIVMLDYSENDANELIRSIICELDSINSGKNETEICSVAFGISAGKVKDGIPELVSQADKKMYINKKEMKSKINRK